MSFQPAWFCSGLCGCSGRSGFWWFLILMLSLRILDLNPFASWPYFQKTGAAITEKRDTKLFVRLKLFEWLYKCINETEHIF